MGKANAWMAAGAIALVACGGQAFSALEPAPVLEGGAPPAADVVEPLDAGTLAADAGELLQVEASALEEASASRADGHRPKPVEGGELLEAAPDVDAGALEHDAGGAVTCTGAAECPSCGSAVSYACCSARGLCGCAFSLGGACVER